jgi:hypothetical protein
VIDAAPRSCARPVAEPRTFGDDPGMLRRHGFLFAACLITPAALVALGCDGGGDTDVPGTGGSGGTTTSSTTTGSGGTGGTGGNGGGGGSGGTGGGPSPTLATFGGSDDDGAGAVVIDSERRIVVSGGFQGDIDFGGGPLSAAEYDGFILSLDAQLAHQWSVQLFTEGGGLNVADLAIGPNDDVVALGNFSGSVQLGGEVLSSPGGSRLLVARFQSDGTLVWARTVDGDVDAYARGVAVDDNGDIFLTGTFYGTLTFEGGESLVAATGDAFLIALAGADGGYRWGRALGGPAGDDGNGVGVGPDGTVVVGGLFQGTADFGGGPVVSAGTKDIFVVRYDSTGAHIAQATFPFDGTGYLETFSMNVDAQNRTVLAGNFGDMVAFGDPPLIGTGQENDIFVAQLDAALVPSWSQAFGMTGEENVRALALGPLGEPTIMGFTTSDIDFGGGTLPLGSLHYYARLSPTGEHVASDRVGTDFYTNAGGIAVDPDGSLVIVGSFEGDLEIGEDLATSVSGLDTFVARIVP